MNFKYSKKDFLPDDWLYLETDYYEINCGESLLPTFPMMINKSVIKINEYLNMFNMNLFKREIPLPVLTPLTPLTPT